MSELLSLASNLRKIAKELEKGEEESPEMNTYKALLRKVKGKESFGKLEYLLNNFKIRKKEMILARAIDDAPEKAIDGDAFYKKMRRLFKTKPNLPAVRFLKKIMDYGVANGAIQLARALKTKRMKMLFGRD